MATAKVQGYSCREFFEILAKSEIREGCDAFRISQSTAETWEIEERQVAWEAFKKLWARQGH